MVTCGSCGKSIAEADAELSGSGFRCAACAMKASIDVLQGGSDVASHLSEAERAQMAAEAKQKLLLGALGLVATAVGTVLLGLFAPRRLTVKVALGGSALSIGSLVVGWRDLRHARGRRAD